MENIVRRIENLEIRDLKDLISNNRAIRNKSEEAYIEYTLDYVHDIIETINCFTKWDIGFYQYNSFSVGDPYFGATIMDMRAFTNGLNRAYESYSFTYEYHKEVLFLDELLTRYLHMDCRNKQYDNLENKIHDLFKIICDKVLDEFNRMVDDKYVNDNDNLLNALVCMIDNGYLENYVVDEELNVYKMID